MRKYLPLLLMVVLIISIAQVSADLYLPTLPTIATGLGVSANSVQWTVSIFMWGFAFSQLVYGPLSDGVGRKYPLVGGLCLLVIGSLICVSSNSIGGLLVGRLLQGFGGGAGATLSRVILRDTYSGHHLAKTLSYLSVVSVIIMASAPVIGGYVGHYFGWSTNFFVLLFYSLLLLLMVCFQLDETNQHKNRRYLKWVTWKAGLKELFRHESYWRYAVLLIAAYSSVLAWLTAGPILLQLGAGVSEIGFGWYALVTGVACGLGGFFNARLIHSLGPKKLLVMGSTLMLVGALAMVFWALIGAAVSVVSVMVPMVVSMVGMGFVFPNSFACALSPFPKIAGLAARILGFFQILGGAVSSGLLAYLPDVTQIPLSAVLLVCAIVSFVTAFVASRAGPANNEAVQN